MKKIFLMALPLLCSLGMKAEDGDEFQVDGVWYTVLSEMDKTCETRSGTGESNGAGNYGISGELKLTNKVLNPDTNIEYTLTKIGDYSFFKCYRLSGELVIPESVTVIGEGAFVYCHEFTGDLVIGNSVTEIGREAFQGCDGFTGNLVIPESVTVIGLQAFESCDGFTGDLVIGNSVTVIGPHAFTGCRGFTGNLIIGNSVTIIGEGAFALCENFTGDLVIPDSVTEIGSTAFYGCTGFTGDLIIGNSVTEIGSAAFFGCIGFTGDLVIGNSVTVINPHAFNGCTGFTGDLIIGNSVTEIGFQAFYGCSGLERIISQNDEPPILEFYYTSYPFDEETFENVPLYVGKRSIDLYKETEGWMNFKTILPLADDTVEPESVSIEGAEGEVMVGSTLQLKAVVEPGSAEYDSLLWSSSDTSVATVDAEGIVTGINAGKATITVTLVLLDEREMTASCEITVVEKENEPGEDDPNQPGEDDPNQPGEDDPNQPGEHDPNQPGEHDPNQPGEDDPNQPGEDLPVALSISGYNSNPILVDATVQLEAVVTPADTEFEEVVWSSSNENVIYVDGEGLATATGVGSATITAAIMLADGTMLTASVEIMVTGYTGIDGIDSEDSYTVYDLHGNLVKGIVNNSDLDKLSKGIYIINGHKVLIK